MDDDAPTMVQLAAKLLRDAAVFFENVGVQNPPLAEQMNDNAEVYRQVAEMLENDPDRRIDLTSGPDLH